MAEKNEFDVSALYSSAVALDMVGSHAEKIKIKIKTISPNGD